MAPIEMRYQSKGQDIGVLWIAPGKSEVIKYVRPAEINVECDNADDDGTLHPIIDLAETVIVKKFSSETDHVGTAITSEEVKFRYPAYVTVEAKFYDEAVRLEHKKAPPRRLFGQIPPNHQPA